MCSNWKEKIKEVGEKELTDYIYIYIRFYKILNLFHILTNCYFLENVEYINHFKILLNILFLFSLIQNVSKSLNVLLKNPFIVFLSNENINFATFFETCTLPFDSISVNFFLAKLNKFSIAKMNVIAIIMKEPENSGVLLGVRSIFTLLSYAIFIIREDLWAQRLSSTNISYLLGYFTFIFSTKLLKYY